MKTFQAELMEKGTTLIEMLAAVAIFAITIGAISGIFVSAIRTQRRVLASQELFDQTSYVLEYMGRALRMARKDSNGNCLTTCGIGCNYENPNYESWRIRFLNHDAICQEFFSENNQLKEKKSGDDTATFPPSGTPITSLKLQVNSLKFRIWGEDQFDDFQPGVTIFLEILGREAIGQPEIQIQTSISQRPLDAP